MLLSVQALYKYTAAAGIFDLQIANSLKFVLSIYTK